MRLLYLLFLPALVCSLASCGGKDKPVDKTPLPKDSAAPAPPKVSMKQGLVYPFLFTKKNKTQYDDAVARWKGQYYFCGYKGKVSRADSITKTRVDLFDIKAEFLVDILYLAPVDSDFVAFWQETDHLGVKSYVARYKRGADKPMWKIRFMVPNIGAPVIDGEDAYATAAGTITRIHLADGSMVWKCDTLYNPIRGMFFKFTTPRVYDSTVVFKEQLTGTGNRKKPDSLRVEAATGKLVRK